MFLGGASFLPSRGGWEGWRRAARRRDLVFMTVNDPTRWTRKWARKRWWTEQDSTHVRALATGLRRELRSRPGSRGRAVGAQRREPGSNPAPPTHELGGTGRVSPPLCAWVPSSETGLSAFSAAVGYRGPPCGRLACACSAQLKLLLAFLGFSPESRTRPPRTPDTWHRPSDPPP